MKKRKIVVLAVNLPNGSAANTALSFGINLSNSGDKTFNRVIGFGLAVQSDGGADSNVQLEPVEGNPLIQFVSKEYLKIGTNSKPDDRLMTVDFPVPNQETIVKVSPRANLTSAAVMQAIFLLSEE